MVVEGENHQLLVKKHGQVLEEVLGSLNDYEWARVEFQGHYY